MTGNKNPIKNGIKTPWHLWVVGLIFIFIYSNGVYDYFMMLGQNIEYYNSKNYGDAVVEYFANYPIVPLILWTINIFGGLIAGILIFFRTEWAMWLSLISSISMLLLEIITFSFMNRWNVLGTFISLFDIGLLIITWGFFFYCKFLIRKKVLK